MNSRKLLLSTENLKSEEIKKYSNKKVTFSGFYNFKLIPTKEELKVLYKYYNSYLYFKEN